MEATTTGGSQANRRDARRIYERINLFYRRLPVAPAADAYRPRTAADEMSLSLSESTENDTLQANISAGGIAFTCREELLPGDYLQLRILLLASLTTISTHAKVVYCKPSNPYENDRFPFTVGARFVNLTDADRALISRYIDSRNRQRWLLTALAGGLLLWMLLAPELAWHLLVGLIHHLFEIILHVLHLAFEYAEVGLDHLVEHAFHTDTHQTQVIVFYILVVIIGGLVFLILRRVPAWFRTCLSWLMLFASRKKSSILYFWQQQSVAGKYKLIGITGATLLAYFYLAF
ncbi:MULTISPECIES: PilZ domain-containing protein [Methylomonas]|uniref:PilZ domain-containing protein n=1 Tax=Methylomonas TaxID=416 RepID=UPI0012320196|nr:PilZ domain-containing protein [Methylomonas rhizoryzae]